MVVEISVQRCEVVVEIGIDVLDLCVWVFMAFEFGEERCLVGCGGCGGDCCLVGFRFCGLLSFKGCLVEMVVVVVVGVRVGCSCG